MSALRNMPERSILVLLAAVVFGTGCVSMTLVKRRQGNPIDVGKAASIHPQKSTLADVLDILGAPQEVHAHPDGRMLIYRYRARNVAELAIEAENVSRFVDVTQTLSGIVGNLSLRWTRIHADEDRIAIIVGKDHRVRGVACRETTPELPVF